MDIFDLESLPPDSCVLCLRNYFHEIQKENVSGLLRKLHELWDAEFAEFAEDSFSSGVFESASFCNDCETLISSGVEFKRKLAVVKEEIANHIEGDGSVDEPVTKLLRSKLHKFIGSKTKQEQETNVEAFRAANRSDSCTSVPEGSILLVVPVEASRTPNCLGDSVPNEESSGALVDDDLLFPNIDTTEGYDSVSMFSKPKIGMRQDSLYITLDTKTPSAKNENQHSGLRKRISQEETLQTGSGETEKKKQREISATEKASEQRLVYPNNEISCGHNDSTKHPKDEVWKTKLRNDRPFSHPGTVLDPLIDAPTKSKSSTSSGLTMLEKTTRRVKCLLIPRQKPAFRSNPSIPEKVKHMIDNSRNVMTIPSANHEGTNSGIPNIATITDTGLQGSSSHQAPKPPSNTSAVIYYDTPQLIVKSGILTRRECKKLLRTRLYKCFFCEDRFCSGISLRIHIQLNHEKRTSESAMKFQCPHCLKEFEKAIFDHDLKPKEECFCHYFGERTVVRKASLETCCSQPTFEKFADIHLRGCKGYWYLKSQPDEFKEKCTSCEQHYPLDLEYYAHLRTHYQTGRVQQLSCPLCSFQTHPTETHGGPSRLNTHMSRKHGITTCGNEQYMCKGCNSFYTPLHPDLESGRLVPEEYSHFKNFVKEHENCEKSSSTRQTEFKCKWCSEIWNTPTGLLTHETTVHTKNLLRCARCDFTSFELEKLEFHARVHEKNFICDRCPKTFLRKSKLKDHITAAHTGERNYVCEECGAAFSLQSNLTRHRKTVHITTKDVLCPQCGKLFRSMKSVRCHVNQVHKIHRKLQTKET